MWTLVFWQGAAERALKTFAQSVLATLTATSTGLLAAPWVVALDLGAMAAVLSILTSLVTVTTVVATSPPKTVWSQQVGAKRTSGGSGS